MSAMYMIRGVLGLCFAYLLATSSALTSEAYFGILARFLIVDGAVAAMIAAALLREGQRKQRTREVTLGVVILVDGGGRTLSGIALYTWPAIAGFPVTAVLYVSTMATCTAAVGFAEAWLTVREEIARHGPTHESAQFMAGPVGIASVVSIGFGVSSIIWMGSVGTMQLLISGFVVAAAVVAMAMAWSRRRVDRQRALLLPAAHG